jgi:hypothetical protein
MIGLEGQTFWALRSSPMKESKIFFIKFIIGFLMVLVSYCRVHSHCQQYSVYQ